MILLRDTVTGSAIIPWQSVYGTVDPGIAHEVDVLRRAGFCTFSSCEGGPGHAFDCPVVRLWPTWRLSCIDAVADALRCAGYDSFILKDCRQHNDAGMWCRFIEVEFIR